MVNLKEIFSHDNYEYKNNKHIVFSNAIWGQVVIKGKGYDFSVENNSPMKTISLFLMILTMLIFYFYVTTVSPLMYVTFGVYSLYQVMSIIIVEIRTLYVKNTINIYITEGKTKFTSA